MRVALASVFASLFASGAVACRSTAPAQPSPAGPIRTAILDAPRPPAAPPSAPLGVRLPTGFRVDSYAPTITIDPAQPTFSGSIDIAGDLATAQSSIWLHAERLQIERATATTATGEVALEIFAAIAPGRVALRAPTPLAAGHVVLSIQYRGQQDDLDTAGVFRQQVDGAWYSFTQHEAIFARRTFPCVDEPDAKVPWTLTLNVPAAMTAIANAPSVTESIAGATKQVRFATTPPLPSYLVAFAVGPFDLVPAGTTSAGAPIRIVTLAGRAADAAFAADATGKLLAELERWFGTPYPYAKLDALSIPTTVGFGAMENPGLITYRESLLLLPADAPEQRKRRYAFVGTHEMAHQWFGDLVTPVWWDDIWLNESFASWLPNRIVSAVFPAWHKPLEQVESRSEALNADSLVSARRIRQPIDSEDDILSAFDGITYGKGAAVLRMFETVVGADAFQRGVRNYVAAHANRNATAADFLAAIAAQAPDRDVPAAMGTLLDQAGAPLITATIACAGGGATIDVQQTRYLPLGAPAATSTPRWRLPICMVAGDATHHERVCVELVDEHTAVAVAMCPTWVWPNADGAGYYRSNVSADQWPTLFARASPLSDREQLAAFGDLNAAIGAGRVGVDVGLRIAASLVGRGRRPEQSLAIDLIDSVRGFVPAASRDRYQRWVRKTLASMARVGLSPRKTDDADRERLRSEVMASIADAGADPTVQKAAVKLARTWRTQPASVRGLILAIAVRVDPSLHAELLAAFRSEHDRVILGDLARGLGAVTDPDQLRAALGLLLDPAIDVRDSLSILFVATDHEATRPVAVQFVRDNLDALIARLPPQTAVALASALTSECDASRIAELRALLGEKIAPLPGGQRRVDQSLERMLQCAAVRDAMSPALTAWAAALPAR